MSESRPILKKLLDQREEVGEELFKNITDPHFGDKAEEYRAITAILVAGIYHLNLYTGHNGVTFCGIEMKTEEGRKKIEKALVDIIDFAYNK